MSEPRVTAPNRLETARLRLSHQGKIFLHGIEADRYVITSHGWLPRRG